MGSIDFGKMQLLQTPICRNVVYQFSNFVSKSALSDLSTEDLRSQIYDARALSRDSPQVASRTHLTNQFAGKNSSLSHKPSPLIDLARLVHDDLLASLRAVIA
jgi:hypothetical protein